MTEYKDGDKVRYKLSEFIEGVAVVRGVSTTPIYGLGAVYILEDLSGNVPNKEYRYKFFTAADLHLQLIN